MTNPLKKAPLRAALILIAFILATVCSYIVVSEIIKAEENDRYISENCYIHSIRYNTELNELYQKLWLAGNMYLANRSGSGYTVNERMQEQIEQCLKEYGVMDRDGSISIGEYNDLEYIVSCNGMTFTNTDKSLDELSSSNYGIWWHDEEVSHDSSFYEWRDFGGYTTNYGKTVYYINGEAHNMYSFDTTGLNYYYYNAAYETDTAYRNYYKLDGSTPLPPADAGIGSENARFFTVYIFSYELEQLPEVIENITSDELYSDDADVEIFMVDDNYNTVAVYDLENETWIYAVVEKAIPLATDLYICIAPSDEAAREYDAAIARLDIDDQQILRMFVVAAICAFFALLTAVLYFVYSGYDANAKSFKLAAFDKWYTEILLGMLGLLALGAYGYISVALDIVPSKEMRDIFIATAYCAGIGVMFVIAVLILGCIINKIKCRRFVETTLIFKLLKFCFRRLKVCFGWLRRGLGRLNRYCRMVGLMSHSAYFKRHIPRYIVATAVAFIVSLIIGTAANDGEAFVIAWLLLTALCALYIHLDLRDARAISRLSKRIEQIREGDYSPEEPDIRDITYKMQEDLNSISSGVSRAVDEQIRSERMKIDLVTNVSHDLKTPLTSIISYVDLLSKEDLPDVAMDYVNVLVNKTQRLKAIISDLFDLAKATSETDMKLEQLDAVILVRQVLADMEDKINRFGRDIRTDIQPESVKVIGEGKKLYRIVQNVIDNALKYSLDNTRIYLTLSQTDTQAVITVKNIASYEMDFTGDEIVERFARGDKSRTSEGNGLGLSIAKSFAQACEGSFEVRPEGDVFTAEIRLKKVEEAKTSVQ